VKDEAKSGPGKAAADARFERIHRALLTGLLGNIGCRTEEDESYQGARGIRFHVHPGSGINKKGAKWVMVGELADTTRLYGRCAARIEPEWIERVAGDRVERTYFEPHWDKARGEVVASERVALYGLTLVPRRRVSFGATDPALARDIFLREGLALGEHGINAPFADHNRKLLADSGALDTTGLAPFAEYARLAVAGSKRFVITHSEIFPGTFASTTECTDWLLATLGIRRVPVLEWGPMGMQLLSRTIKGRFEVLGFAGNSGPDHIDQFHGMAAFVERLLAP